MANDRAVMGRFIFACGLFLALGTAAASAETDVGALFAVLSGTHTGADNPTLTGIAPGALLEVTQKMNGVRIHLEGIPHVTVSGSNGGAFGTSTASLSILNATVMVDVDPNHRFRVGTGFQLINLSNYNGNNGDTNYARVTSPRYEVGSTLPLPSDHFVELELAVMPNVRGLLHAHDQFNVPEVDKPELGSEVDYAIGYGWKGGATVYVIGLRALNYKTRNVNTGALVDSNVGAGGTFEIRFPVAR